MLVSISSSRTVYVGQSQNKLVCVHGIERCRLPVWLTEQCSSIAQRKKIHQALATQAILDRWMNSLLFFICLRDDDNKKTRAYHQFCPLISIFLLFLFILSLSFIGLSVTCKLCYTVC